jgi:hypothetical protein
MILYIPENINVLGGGAPIMMWYGRSFYESTICLTLCIRLGFLVVLSLLVLRQTLVWMDLN